MSTRLLLISDTHIPGRARILPPELVRAATEADIVIHAGDWVSLSVLREIEQLAEVVGVYGNNDGADLRAVLPEVATREIDEIRFAVVHETGAAQGRERRMDAAYPGADVLVFGHSHIPWDSRSPAGLRLLNPGSPTDRRRQPQCTMMTAIADAGELRDVTLVALPPRGGTA